MAAIAYSFGPTYDPILGHSDLNQYSVYYGPSNTYYVSVRENNPDFTIYLTNIGAHAGSSNNYFSESNFSVCFDFSDNLGSVNLRGGSSGDSLSGGSGDDTLSGGAGDDTLEGGQGNNLIDGGTGVNLVSYEHYDNGTGQGVVAHLDTGSASSSAGSDLSDDLFNFQDVRGSQFADIITGDSGSNVIEGGAGGDQLFAGDGIDTVTYVHSTAGVTVSIVDGSVGSGGDAQGDVLFGFENLTGSAFNDLLTGNDLDNVLSGGGGKDYLEGGGGADTLIGGAGNDVYILRVGDHQVTITEAANGGTDTVRSAVTITALAANVENVQLVGKTDLDATGNGLKNMIVGNTADNHIDGGDGRDVLTGYGGNDTFVFDTALGVNNLDRITDFNLNDPSHHDTIALDQTIFAAVGFNADGTLKDGEFAVIDATHKATASAHLLYNADKGALFYDADGRGGQAAVQVVVFDGKPLLTADDIHALIS